MADLLLAAFDGSRQGIVVHDGEGRVVDCNPAAADLLGVSFDAMLGTTPDQPVWDRLRELDGRVIAPADRPAAVVLRTSQPLLGRLLDVRRDSNSEVILRVDVHPAVGEDGTLVVASFVDVTGEVEAQRAAAETSRQLETTLAETRRLATEQAAVGRIATAIAQQRDDATIFTLIAEELARLFDADGAVVVELPEAGPGVLRGTAARPGREAVIGSSGLHRLLDSTHFTAPGSSGIVRITAEPGPAAPSAGVAAPVQIAGRTWGYVAVVGAQERSLTDNVEQRLARITELIATAVIAAAARAQLIVEATQDPVTGLLNHRAFQERLHTEVQRARRHGRQLSLAVLDLDDFKAINDSYGHQAGDRVLCRVGDVLRDVGRDGDVVARLGGDEFALLLPETDAAGASLAAERALALLKENSGDDELTLTASVGVADLCHADSADRLLKIADGALYWAKAHGRDAVRPYSPDVVPELSGQERTERLARSQALTALRALARVIELKAPPSAAAPDRAAALARALAGARDWPAEDVATLREALRRLQEDGAAD
ncbi:MAG: diguanylate cyclase [Solirubrobacteraceae bacterium]